MELTNHLSLYSSRVLWTVWNRSLTRQLLSGEKAQHNLDMFNVCTLIEARVKELKPHKYIIKTARRVAEHASEPDVCPVNRHLKSLAQKNTPIYSSNASERSFKSFQKIKNDSSSLQTVRLSQYVFINRGP